MSSSEFAGWMAFDRLERIGQPGVESRERKADWRMAYQSWLAYTLRQTANMPNKEVVDFLPQWADQTAEAEPEQTPEHLAAKIHAAFASTGGTEA